MKKSENSLFSNVKNKFLSHKNSTNDYIFNGKSIQEKNGNVKFMTITVEDDFFDHSTEELRLADYKQTQEGNNIFKSEDITEKNSIFTETSNKEDKGEKNQNIFLFQGKGNDLNISSSQEKSFFSTNKEDISNNKEYNLMQSGLFDNKNNNEEENKEKLLLKDLFSNKKSIK